MSPGVAGAATGLGATINDILTNTGTGSGTSVYTVVGTGPAGLQSCAGEEPRHYHYGKPAPAITKTSIKHFARICPAAATSLQILPRRKPA